MIVIAIGIHICGLAQHYGIIYTKPKLTTN